MAKITPETKLRRNAKKPTNNRLSEKEMELARMLMSECKTTSDVQEKLKRLFAGTIEQMLEAEMYEHLGYEKNSVLGNNSGNSRNGYGKKTIISNYGECEIAINAQTFAPAMSRCRLAGDQWEFIINEFVCKSFESNIIPRLT